MRRGAPVVLVALGLLLLVASYVVYTRRVVRELQREASRTGRMFARVYDALADPRDDAGTAALLDLSRQIREMGVPVVVTDDRGRPAAAANLPFHVDALDDPRVLAYAEELDRENSPVVEPGIGTVHYGSPPVVRGLRVVPALQAGLLLVLVAAGAYALRARARAERERVWAGMARESAHQLGTPLSSLAGWVELLEERAGDPLLASAVAHMRGDVQRLERVAHRFERIGRPPRREPVDVAEIARACADYFRARVPTLAHSITIDVLTPAEPVVVQGDAVLLEWALEALAKNAVDALAAKGGHITMEAAALPAGGARLRIEDDGPGVPRELRGRIFEAGVSTKERGWGIGLALARRIVEENHGGRLSLAPSERGAAFEIILRGCRPPTSPTPTTPCLPA